MKDTKIAWTHHTFNPWWGCTKVSPACTSCYAEAFAKRTGHTVWGADAPRRLFGDKHWNEPLAWDRDAALAGERRRVFSASMADVFEDRRDLDSPRARLFELIKATRNLDWLLLTKRPENMPRLAPVSWRNAWPFNAWAGTTVEDQPRANMRIGALQLVPAPVQFLSMEPLLEAVRLPETWLYFAGTIQWCIVGGESGHVVRPLNVEWVRSLVRQCSEAGVKCFVKQDSGRLPGKQGRIPDDLWIKEFPR